MDHHCWWLGNCVGKRTHVNFVLFLASSSCFYLMLFRLNRMLHYVITNRTVVLGGRAAQFQAIRIGVIAVWHIFPCVFL